MSKPRKPKGRPISGWLILDKPVDFGSTEAVGKIKWLFNAQKAGHAGTLDPLASGMLPIALGDATKTVPYVMDGRKVYLFTLKFGEERATDDAEGGVLDIQSAVARHRGGEPVRSAHAPRLGEWLGSGSAGAASVRNGRRGQVPRLLSADAPRLPPPRARAHRARRLRG